VATDSNKNKPMPVKMGYGAFRPTRRTPYFPGTEPTNTNASNQYKTVSTGMGSAIVNQEGYYYNGVTPNEIDPQSYGLVNPYGESSVLPESYGTYTQGNQYSAVSQADGNQYYQSGTGQAYGDNPYGQASTSDYTTGGANAYAAVEASGTSPRSGKGKEPTCIVAVRKLPGRDKQRSRTAIRDLIRENIPQDIALSNGDFSFMLGPEGEPLDYVYIKFKTREEAKAAKEQLDGQWLEIGTKRRKVEAGYAKEIPGKKSKEKDRPVSGSSSADTPAREVPVIVDGSYRAPPTSASEWGQATQAPVIANGSYQTTARFPGWAQVQAPVIADGSFDPSTGMSQVAFNPPSGPAAERQSASHGSHKSPKNHGKGSGHHRSRK